MLVSGPIPRKGRRSCRRPPSSPGSCSGMRFRSSAVTKPEWTRRRRVPPSALTRVKVTIVSRSEPYRAIVAVVAASPRKGQPLVRHHFEHLAMDDAVPGAGRRRLKGEARAFHRLEPSRRHQEPAADRARRSSAFSRSFPAHAETPPRPRCLACRTSIAASFMDRSPSRRVLRLANRSRQKTP